MNFLALALVAQVNLSGVYQTIKADCNIWDVGFRSNSGLAVNDLARIEASPTQFQILASSETYAPGVFSRVFDYREFKVGTRKTACALENCFQLDVGAYSPTGFKLVRQLIQPGYAVPLSVHTLEVRQLSDGIVEVLNDGKQCLLKRKG